MDQPKSPSKKRYRYVLFNFLGMAAVLAAIILGTFWGISAYTHHGEEISVPDVCGLTCDEATARLEAAGLQAEVRDTGYVRRLPAGTILEQSVAAGQKVKSGRMVLLTVNSGNSPTVMLPDIADNSSLREAESRLRAMGFRLDSTQRIRGEQDWVYEVKANGRVVAAGQRIPIDAVITLVAGDGNNDDEYLETDSTDNLFWNQDEEAIFGPETGDGI